MQKWSSKAILFCLSGYSTVKKTSISRFVSASLYDQTLTGTKNRTTTLIAVTG